MRGSLGAGPDQASQVEGEEGRGVQGDLRNVCVAAPQACEAEPIGAVCDRDRVTFLRFRKSLQIRLFTKTDENAQKHP